MIVDRVGEIYHEPNPHFSFLINSKKLTKTTDFLGFNAPRTSLIKRERLETLDFGKDSNKSRLEFMELGIETLANRGDKRGESTRRTS